MSKLVLLTFLLQMTFISDNISANNIVTVDTIIVKNHAIILYDLIFSVPDSCGDARLSSYLFSTYHARVKRIITPELIEVLLVDNSEISKLGFLDQSKKLIYLAGISSLKLNKTKYDLAIKFLNQMLLERKVEIYTNQIDISDTNEINGMVRLKDISINYTMLKNGLTTFIESKTYSVDFWTRCHLRKAAK